MTNILLIILIAMTSVVVLILLLQKAKTPADTKEVTNLINSEIGRLERNIKEEFAMNRQEMAKGSKETREELISFLRTFRDSISNTMTDISNLQKNQLETFSGRIDKMSQSVNENLDKIRVVLEQRIKELQEDNSKKLDLMRATVDEKLQTTLEKRLNESFKIVSERLEAVHKGLGEMQTLATGVGDLKKVLSNVKTRGILGELQLGNLLDQILTRDQYDTNIATVRGSKDVVEFAIKLPGKDDLGQVVYMPIDSKFPLGVYEELVDAYDSANPQLIEEKSKVLDVTIRKCAKDIHDKYIGPPDTTDFAIMFLPVEGLFAEVVRKPGFLEALQRDFKIVITGPTTLAALLNSLQMGFRTLVIEKRTSEVWRILGAVKSEFGKFSEVLKRAQDKIRKAGDDIDELVGTRTNQIQRKLRDVHDLPAGESKSLLENDNLPDETENGESKE
jgi:DNA recombination protein RmuC